MFVSLTELCVVEEERHSWELSELMGVACKRTQLYTDKWNVQTATNTTNCCAIM